MPTAVLRVDDHELMRTGLHSAGETSPEVLVTDVRIPDGSGTDPVRTLSAQSNCVGIVVLTMYAGHESVPEALSIPRSSSLADGLSIGPIARRPSSRPWRQDCFGGRSTAAAGRTARAW